MTKPNKSKKPDFYARYEGPGRDDYRSIGAAWQNEDGSVYLKMNGVPLGAWNGAIWLFPPKSQDDEAEHEHQGTIADEQA
ncbi:MAG: hypothetical protein AAGA97_02620 [Pseudomonadota bacterium]